MVDRDTIIKGCENWIKYHKGEDLTLEFTAVEELLSVLKEQEDMSKELTNAYGYLQKQFFEVQDKLLKEHEAVVPIPLSNRRYACGNCGNSLWVSGQRFCASCGKAVKWDV